MSRDDKFNRYLIAHGAAKHRKFRRMSTPERYAFFLGVLSLAAQAPTRGCLLIGNLPVEPEDVAHECDVPINVARSALAKLREVGVVYFDEDMGCDRVHDFDDWQIRPKSDKNGARRVALHRNLPLRTLVRDRDQGRCRYCNVEVRWNDRRGLAGGTYDHIDPVGPNAEWNLVVACRSCNSSKRDRTPAEAGMVLLPEPTAVSRSDLDTGSKSFAAISAPEVEIEKEDPRRPPGGGQTETGRLIAFRRRPVPDEIRTLAEAILADFNQQAGTNYGAYTAEGKPSEDLKRILGAIHDATPPLTLTEAQHITRWRLQHPFWTGRPHTGVVYGPNVFPSNRESVTSPTSNTPTSRDLAAAYERATNPPAA